MSGTSYIILRVGSSREGSLVNLNKCYTSATDRLSVRIYIHSIVTSRVLECSVQSAKSLNIGIL